MRFIKRIIILFIVAMLSINLAACDSPKSNEDEEKVPVDPTTLIDNEYTEYNGLDNIAELDLTSIKTKALEALDKMIHRDVYYRLNDEIKMKSGAYITAYVNYAGTAKTRFKKLYYTGSNYTFTLHHDGIYYEAGKITPKLDESLSKENVLDVNFKEEAKGKVARYEMGHLTDEETNDKLYQVKQLIENGKASEEIKNGNKYISIKNNGKLEVTISNNKIETNYTRLDLEVASAFRIAKNLLAEVEFVEVNAIIPNSGEPIYTNEIASTALAEKVKSEFQQNSQIEAKEILTSMTFNLHEKNNEEMLLNLDAYLEHTDVMVPYYELDQNYDAQFTNPGIRVPLELTLPRGTYTFNHDKNGATFFVEFTKEEMKPKARLNMEYTVNELNLSFTSYVDYKTKSIKSDIAVYIDVASVRKSFNYNYTTTIINEYEEVRHKPSLHIGKVFEKTILNSSSFNIDGNNYFTSGEKIFEKSYDQGNRFDTLNTYLNKILAAASLYAPIIPEGVEVYETNLTNTSKIITLNGINMELKFHISGWFGDDFEYTHETTIDGEKFIVDYKFNNKNKEIVFKVKTGNQGDKYKLSRRGYVVEQLREDGCYDMIIVLPKNYIDNI